MDVSKLNDPAPSYPRIDLVGRKFGKLLVTGFAGRKRGNGKAFWACKCSCGAISIASGDHLKSGLTTTCGCGIRRGLAKANTTHGLTRAPEYKIWAGMISRCYNEKEKAYQFYGARGIKVCARWRNSFANFISDMGNRPSQDHWIERSNNNGHYSPLNCVWLHRDHQHHNKRSTIRVRGKDGITSLKDACRQLGVNYYSVRSRMQRRNISFEQAAQV